MALTSGDALGELRANMVKAWPQFTLAPTPGDVIVFEVAMAGTPEEHGKLAERWGRSVWAAWTHIHAEIVRTACS